MKIQRRDEHTAMPWKNGGGVTYEVARDGEGDDFTWRISFAEVNEPGPFSTFEGIDRVITLVKGEGLLLKVTNPEGDVEEQLLRVGEPFAFPGEAPVTSEPVGPSIDLNLMTRRGQAWGNVDVIAVDGDYSVFAPAEISLVAVLEGACDVDGEQLAPLDVAFVEGEIACSGHGLLAVMGVTVAEEPA